MASKGERRNPFATWPSSVSAGSRRLNRPSCACLFVGIVRRRLRQLRGRRMQKMQTACDSERDEGLWCRASTGKRERKPFPSNIGDSCGVQSDMAEVLFCRGDLSCEDAKCAAKLGDGAACNAGAPPRCTARMDCFGGICSLPPANECQ
jgi:hypothetical protein